MKAFLSFLLAISLYILYGYNLIIRYYDNHIISTTFFWAFICGIIFLIFMFDNNNAKGIK